MDRAVADLEKRGEAVTARALAATAHISLNTACTWLRKRETGAMEAASALLVLHYSSYSIADNMPAAENSACTQVPVRIPESMDPPEASPTPPDGAPLLPALPAICPVASHQLLWRWSAGTWHCPVCNG